LNDVIRDLGLPKGKVELLGSRLKEKNLLAAGTSMQQETGVYKLLFTGW
jgi:hypothetical protein